MPALVNEGAPLREDTDAVVDEPSFGASVRVLLPDADCEADAEPDDPLAETLPEADCEPDCEPESVAVAVGVAVADARALLRLLLLPLLAVGEAEALDAMSSCRNPWTAATQG